MLDREARVTLAEIADALARGARASPTRRSCARWTGMDRFVARKAIVAELERLELLEKIEPHTHQVPHGDRGGVPIEPLLTTQWYCNADGAGEAGDRGGGDRQDASSCRSSGRTRSSPGCATSSRGASSRQLWWGHRIPAWYGPDGAVFVAR